MYLCCFAATWNKSLFIELQDVKRQKNVNLFFAYLSSVYMLIQWTTDTSYPFENIKIRSLGGQKEDQHNSKIKLSEIKLYKYYNSILLISPHFYLTY